MTLEAVILAGGLSRRMGRDKAELRLGGRRILTLVRDACRRSGLDCRVIRRDLVPRCGPLGGMVTALATSKQEACLLLTCDMPFVSAELLAALISQAKRRPQRPWFSHQDGRFGFPALLRKKDEPVLRRAIEADQLGVQSLARALKAGRFQVAPEDSLGLFNVNTPAEWREARRLWKAHRDPLPPRGRARADHR